MGGIGRIIGGALVGLGEGMEKQTIVNERQRIADMENQRAIALENLRASNTRANATNQYDLADRNNARDSARDFGYGTQKVAQEQGFKATDREDEQAHDVTLKNLEHKHKLSEDQANDVRDFAEEAKKAGTYIDRSEIMADGRMVVWTKTGTSRIIGQPGSFVPKGSGSDDEDGGTISEARSSRGIGGAAGGAAPAPAPAPQTKPQGQKPAEGGGDRKAQAVAMLATRYHLIQQDPGKYRSQYPGMFDADGKLLPLAELRQRIQQGS